MCEVLSQNGQKIKFLLSPGQTVEDLVHKVAGKFHYSPSSVRLFFSGRELKPPSAPLDRFEIGKYENFLIHVSTTTIEILENSVQPRYPSISCDVVDLTSSTNESTVDLTSTSPQAQERKKRRIISDLPPMHQETFVSLQNVLSKQLRINITRALNHRLCILENRIVNHSSHSINDDISVEFIIQDSGVAKSYLVRVGVEVSCQCENTCTPCPHILFILMKVFRLSPEDPSFVRSPITFSRETLNEMFVSKGYISSDPGVVYCGTRAATFHPIARVAPKKIVPRVVIEEPECSICLRTLIIPPESFDSGDELVACKKCHNKLHSYCIQQWLQRSQTCPNCRFSWKISKTKPNKSSRLVR